MNEYVDSYLTTGCKMCEYWDSLRGCTMSQPILSCSYYAKKRQQEKQNKLNKYKNKN